MAAKAKVESSVIDEGSEEFMGLSQIKRNELRVTQREERKAKFRKDHPEVGKPDRFRT